MKHPLLPLVAAALLVGWGGHAFAEAQKRKVMVEAPVLAEVTRHLETTGSFRAVNQIDLVARVSGTLEKVNFKDGDTVRAGDVVFVIEPEPYRISLAAAEAELRQQQANLQQATSNAIRQEGLSAQRVVSQSANESAAAQKLAAEAQVAAAETKVRSAELNLSYTEVKAPFDGILAARTADVGAFINAASAPKLASLVEPDPLHVVFSASERQVIAIRRAMAERNIDLKSLGAIRVEAGLQGDVTYPYVGQLDYIAPDIDSATGTITLRGIVSNPNRLLSPGMFARVRVPIVTRKALTVPEAAIGNSQSGRTLQLVDAEGKVATVRVALGEKTDDGRREIVDGLKEGDRVIVKGGSGLRAGEAVEIVATLGQP
ncbi:efflux RND transporter periplasmic adaptor subunit [Rhizobium sp. RU36D]|uniref:efflux RND transporter periplasmic adaptor subunit n=1 Tax=Rhizobium sp. RU36D TaxID=1907415 RepID=UPI0009D875FD|nr:efflux RND transporter periplasmic adaptor subunit [Rhizobium sp. RU36D]SMC52557.1 RND family efflux transporter, MFP subunit [Rhizobium sp. RU36D]